MPLPAACVPSGLGAWAGPSGVAVWPWRVLHTVSSCRGAGVVPSSRAGPTLTLSSPVRCRKRLGTSGKKAPPLGRKQT